MTTEEMHQLRALLSKLDTSGDQYLTTCRNVVYMNVSVRVEAVEQRAS